jgi:transcriptional regulator GlxA family with amidase domain
MAKRSFSERCKNAALASHQNGVEITPAEVPRMAHEALSMIRAVCAKKEVKLPKDDTALIALLRRTRRNKDKE